MVTWQVSYDAICAIVTNSAIAIAQSKDLN